MKTIITRFNKILIALLSVIVFSATFFITNTNADINEGGRAYNAEPWAWYDSSVANYGYTSNFDAGRAYWNSHSRVNVKRALTYNVLYDKYYIGNTSTPGLLGRASYFNSSGAPVGKDSYHDYVVVTLYDNQMRAMNPYSTSYINMNAAHEIGHSIKMTHAASAYNSVMPQGWRAIPSSLTPYDSGEVSRKWGY